MPAELYKMLNKFGDHLTGRFLICYLALFSVASFLFVFTYHSYRNSVLEDLLIKSLIDGARSIPTKETTTFSDANGGDQKRGVVFAKMKTGITSFIQDK
ncbi:hypothetical protein OUZ56_003838 [Daphnia magna]|uniref:Uncharacterized protein n=1 Tax=Daphnia magna TaxID=35525 RepID=A0ABQ9YN30_9CRUS|nr:hypothetical protein OUZ56_003838 [Daphnia magna]